ncbi:phosphatidylethanolamine-binding protein [Phascolomyces articulosus]|uniref:Phosphatidylethanolamine-binding protein n=1 Tax=Phascolomyces articulosus TaxID=60185 RepID=A0AAD5JZ88_9FUNG|nr:phosphatidylethanolamine-binding protein [Phascolomyces articulosus]
MLGLFHWISVIALFNWTVVWGLNSAVIKQGLEKGGIIPDVHNEFEPESELRITYHMTKLLRMGMAVTAEETEKSPHVWFSKTNDVSQYTLMMTDPDAGEGAPFLHWIVTNIDGQKPASDVDNEEHQHTTYMPPAPPAGTGAHRYVFSIYEQSQVNQTNFVPSSIPDRHHFDAATFAQENNMKLVGALYMTQENPTSS